MSFCSSKYIMEFLTLPISSDRPYPSTQYMMLLGWLCACIEISVAVAQISRVVCMYIQDKQHAV